MTTQTPDSTETGIAGADHISEKWLGDPKTVGRLQQITRAVNRNSAAVQGPRMLLNRPRVAGATTGGLQVKVAVYGHLTRDGGQPTVDNAHFDNHIEAWATNEDGDRIQFLVAKPYDLQRRIFEQSRNIRRPAPSSGSRDNVVLSYVRLSPDRRAATESIGGIETGDEDQVITPAYALGSPSSSGGDTLLIARVGSAATGVDGVEWLDLNLAGRAFMREPT